MRLLRNTKCECRVAGAFADYNEVEGTAVSYAGIYGHPLAGTVQKVIPGAFTDFLAAIAPPTPGKPQPLPPVVDTPVDATTGYWVEGPWMPETKAELVNTSNGTLSFFDTPEALKFRLKLDKDDATTNEFYKYVVAGFRIYCSVAFSVAAAEFQGGFESSPKHNYDIAWDPQLLKYVMTIKKCGIEEIWFHLWKESEKLEKIK